MQINDQSSKSLPQLLFYSRESRVEYQNKGTISRSGLSKLLTPCMRQSQSTTLGSGTAWDRKISQIILRLTEVYRS